MFMGSHGKNAIVIAFELWLFYMSADKALEIREGQNLYIF
jgi:hypothetical protein